MYVLNITKQWGGEEGVQQQICCLLVAREMYYHRNAATEYPTQRIP